MSYLFIYSYLGRIHCWHGRAQQTGGEGRSLKGSTHCLCLQRRWLATWWANCTEEGRVYVKKKKKVTSYWFLTRFNPLVSLKPANNLTSWNLTLLQETAKCGCRSKQGAKSRTQVLQNPPFIPQSFQRCSEPPGCCMLIASSSSLTVGQTGFFAVITRCVFLKIQKWKNIKQKVGINQL